MQFYAKKKYDKLSVNIDQFYCPLNKSNILYQFDIFEFSAHPRRQYIIQNTITMFPIKHL